MAVNTKINLGVGNVSWSQELGGYYQDFKEASFHFDNFSMGKFDENGIPLLFEGDTSYYSVVYIIQYALMQHDYIVINDSQSERKKILLNCLNWLDENAVEFNDSIVWKSKFNIQYNLKDGWISAMYQGQAISLYLRAAQLFENQSYVEKAERIFNYFKYDFSVGGAKRIDSDGDVWLEEYPSDPPSFVLNGFVYSIFGVIDLYRVTKNNEAKILFEACFMTLDKNIEKYDRFYWSVYDQYKKELVSEYYQKNVHIPLMKILFLLTDNSKFQRLATKWEKQLNSKFYRLLVMLMYRIQPRLIKILRWIK